MKHDRLIVNNIIHGYMYYSFCETIILKDDITYIYILYLFDVSVLFVIHVVDKMSCAWVVSTGEYWVSVCICLSWMLWLVLCWDLFFVTQHPEASQSEAWPRWRWSVSYSVSRTITESCSHAAVMLSCSVQNLISRSHSICLQTILYSIV